MNKIRSLSFDREIPKTKRFFYYTIINFLENFCDKINERARPTASIAFTGPRYCGKTTILEQVYGYLKEFDINVWFKTFTEDEEMLDFKDYVLDNQYSVVLVDEICKASNQTQVQFAQAVNTLQIYGVVVIYTGSVACLENRLFKNFDNPTTRNNYTISDLVCN